MSRRIFEQGEATPDDDSRLAFGKASFPTKNITMVNFVTYLLSKLAFLKKANNLSDINDAATARGNLGVYSKSQIDDALALAAVLYQSASGSVLGTNNTLAYTPVGDYNPATKKYAEEASGGVLQRGLTSVFDIGTGYSIKRITLPRQLLNANYIPIISVLSNKTTNWDQDVVIALPSMTSRTTAYFDVVLYPTQSDQTQSISIFYELKSLPSDINVAIS